MPDLLVETVGAVATVTVSHEGRRNSLTAEMWQAFPPMMSTLASDSAVKVVVIRGAGADFSAGADVRNLGHILRPGEEIDGGYVSAAEEAIAAYPGATIAAIDGFCVGGGWEIAAACDIRVATARSQFGVTPARLGIVYPLSGIRRLVEVAGPAVAKQLLFSGDIVDSSTALRWGLVSTLHPVDTFWSEISEFAAHLANRSQLSIHAMKDLVDGVVAHATDLDARNARWQAEVSASDDPAIGASAFLSRAEPQFTWSPMRDGDHPSDG